MYRIWPISAFKTAGLVALLGVMCFFLLLLWIGKSVDKNKPWYYCFVAIFLLVGFSFSINNLYVYYNPLIVEENVCYIKNEPGFGRMAGPDKIIFQKVGDERIYLEADLQTVLDVLSTDALTPNETYRVIYEQHTMKLLDIELVDGGQTVF